MKRMRKANRNLKAVLQKRSTALPSAALKVELRRRPPRFI